MAISHWFAVLLLVVGITSASNVVVFDDYLGTNWEDWSAADHLLTGTSKVKAGVRSIKWTLTAFSTLSFNNDQLIDLSKYESLVFSVYGNGVGDVPITTILKDANGVSLGSTSLPSSSPVLKNAWTKVVINLNNFASGKAKTLMFQYASSTASYSVYLDELYFVARDYVYNDGMGDWDDWSAATHNLQVSSPKYAGAYSMSWSLKAWSTLSFVKEEYVKLDVYSTLILYLYGGSEVSGTKITITLKDVDNNPLGSYTIGDTVVKSGKWVVSYIPLSYFSIASGDSLYRIVFQYASSTDSGTLNLDAIYFSSIPVASVYSTTSTTGKSTSTTGSATSTTSTTRAATTTGTSTTGSTTSTKVKLTGINLSAAGFGPGALPGVEGTNYQWPTTAYIDYFVNLGMNTFRIPFLWERIQYTKRGALATDYAAKLKTTVEYITVTKGKYVIIDVHNYQKYFGAVIGESSSVTAADFLDLWTKLFNLLNGYGNKIIWGLMNEPLGTDIKLWRDICQTLVNGLRALGAKQLILVPGQSYTGASSWAISNGMTMWNVSDPLNNIAIEIHSYFDKNTGGSEEECVSTTIGVERLNYVTKWLRAYNKVGFLGEYGAGRTSTCFGTLTNTLDFLETNNDVWLGWTYWAGGPGWDDYIYNLSPNATGIERPQTKYIKPFINSVVPSSISVNKYTPAGDVYLPLYDDVLSNIFNEYSWASSINYLATSKVYKGSYSLSFVGKAISWATTDRSPIEVPKFKGLSFWVHPNGAALSTLTIQLTNYRTSPWQAVSPFITADAYVVSGPTSSGWYQVLFPFSLFADGSYSGIMFLSNSAVTTFLDEVYLVHQVTKAVVA